MNRDDEQRDGNVVEYVLGTLTSLERQAFERRLADEPALAASVREWQERLAPLASPVNPVQPSARLWSAIEAEIVARSEPVSTAPLPFPPATLAALLRSRARWRAATIGASALAAALALAIGLAPTAVTPAGGLVAVVNRSGDLPALLVRVDRRTGIVQVRAVAAETPADRSLELWSLVGGEAPHSLGILGPGTFWAALRGEDLRHLDGAKLAVSVEPRGGSPTGAPTGPVVYSGQLIAENGEDR